MGRYDLSNEGRRLGRRPSEEPIALLGLLSVTPVGDASAFAVRLRELIASAVEIAGSVNFELDDDVAIETLPSWFLNLSDGSSDAVGGDPAGSEGKAHYLELRDNRPWDSEDWIYCFDPDLRAWSWWDVTISEEGSACVWVDTKGEAHIPSEELWWAIYVSGARQIESMTLEASAVWETRPSIGLEA